MGSVQTIKPTLSPDSKVPLNYPTIPAPGKLQLLWQTNESAIYHKLSPYANYGQNQLFNGFTVQPYYYVYPDQNNQGLNALVKYSSWVYPGARAAIDVIRVSKFLGSSNGIIFLGKQFLLQTGNAYNETRIYNPTSPIIAAGQSLALGAVAPQRAFDSSAGLAGIGASLIGSAIPNAIFGTPKINPPSGTIAGALSDAMLTTGGKGLLRAQDANKGLAHFQSAWPQTNKGTGINSSFGSFLSNVVTTMFANFIPASQNGIVAKSDEGSYGLMVGGGALRFQYNGANGGVFGFGQQWIAGGKVTRKTGQYPSVPYRLFTGADGTAILVSNDNLSSYTIPGVGQVGYTVTESTNAVKPGYRYGDNLGTTVDDEYAASDVMVQYANYSKPENKYPTKQTSNAAISAMRLNLNKMITDLKSGVYTLDPLPDNSRVISSGLSTSNGYDRLFATNQKYSTPLNYPQGVLQDYRTSRVVDNSIAIDAVNNSLKLPGAGNFDAINTLTVLGADKSIPNSMLKGWNKWNPYVDDQIALYFYDVVNEKYIPFRAAIKGLTESANATWEEMSFIGRADKIYSYNGFNRNLTLTININISSIVELAPTWQRINYMTTLVKPANYTTTTLNQVTNRFMVPPMVMLTLGDMYKDQPILIQSVTTAVPDDAIWETANEYNSPQGWSYLAGYLKAPNVLYGQLPRTVDLSFGLLLLEKERAIVGGANFGNAPRTEDWKYWNVNAVPDGGTPNKLNQSLVVPQDRSQGTKIYSKEEAAAISTNFQ